MEVIQDYHLGATLVELAKDNNITPATIEKWANKISLKEANAAVSKKNLNLKGSKLKIAKLLCKGLNNREIGKKIGLSKRTIDLHRNEILKAAGCKNWTELAYLIGRGKVKLT